MTGIGFRATFALVKIVLITLCVLLAPHTTLSADSSEQRRAAPEASITSPAKALSTR